MICGEINDELVQRITEKICLLRSQNSEPITVYINSPGGFIANAEQIRHLLTTPNQDGEVCRTITVATNQADSAAAGLLALGDYAIAYPNARIHCHGARLAGREITSQRAEDIAASLRQNDDEFALKLAQRTFERMAFHFANLKGGFDGTKAEYKKATGEDLKSDLECFAYEINSRLTLPFKKLPSEAFLKHMRLVDIQTHVFASPLGVEADEPLAKKEAVLLARLLDYEMKCNDLDKWSLSNGGIEDLALDFNAFADYLFGPHRFTIDQHLDRYGSFFLSSEQIKEYVQQCRQGEDIGRAWLREQAEPLLDPMWYFVVSLCRLLQTGEHPLTATDAYWLGMVDEVIGQKLPSFRLIAENPDPNLNLDLEPSTP